MLYTDKSIRFADSEIAAYRAEGVDVTQITTYRQFVQIVNQQRRNQRKENNKMAKRFGRRALNGTTEYFDTHDELIAAQRRDVAYVQTVLFRIIGLIAGGMLAYALMRWMHVDSRIIRFAAVIVGAWLGGTLGASLSSLLWMIIKWTLILMMIATIGFAIFLFV